jgi:hypothetical protein
MLLAYRRTSPDDSGSGSLLAIFGLPLHVHSPTRWRRVALKLPGDRSAGCATVICLRWKVNRGEFGDLSGRKPDLVGVHTNYSTRVRMIPSNKLQFVKWKRTATRYTPSELTASVRRFVVTRRLWRWKKKFFERSEASLSASSE